jgi:hypothetical protein
MASFQKQDFPNSFTMFLSTITRFTSSSTSINWTTAKGRFMRRWLPWTNFGLITSAMLRLLLSKAKKMKSRAYTTFWKTMLWPMFGTYRSKRLSSKIRALTLTEESTSLRESTLKFLFLISFTITLRTIALGYLDHKFLVPDPFRRFLLVNKLMTRVGHSEIWWRAYATKLQNAFCNQQAICTETLTKWVTSHKY